MAEPQAEPPPAHAQEYFVVSMGLETWLYHDLLKEIHNLREVVVDVRDKIKAPPKGSRIKGARYPDARVVAQIIIHEDFPLVVSNCEKVLEDRGIVVVGCKSGIRKAPTIAAAVERKSFNAYTVHCSLHQFTKTDMMLSLIHI